MRRLYTMILMGVAALTASAADWTYMPMVREGVEWHYTTNSFNEDGYDATEVYLRFDGKETIGDKTYSVLYRYDSPEFDKSNARVAAYMREDGEKVYSICKLMPNGDVAEDNGEVLAYDFATPDGGSFSIVEKSDFVTIDGVSRKALYGNGWIWAVDGIGMATDIMLDGYLPYPFNSMAPATFYFCTRLVDLKDIATGKTVYSHDDFYGSVGSVETGKVNVAVDGGMLTVSCQDDECVSVALTSATGAAVARAGSSQLSTAGLQRGVYVVTATMASGKQEVMKVAF